MTEEKQPWDDESWRRDPKNWDFDNLKKGKTVWGEPVDRESEEYKTYAVIGECLMLCGRLRKTKEALKEADEIKRAEIFKQQDELVEKIVGLSHKIPRLVGTRRVLGFILLQLREIRTDMASYK